MLNAHLAQVVFDRARHHDLSRRRRDPGLMSVPLVADDVYTERFAHGETESPGAPVVDVRWVEWHSADAPVAELVLHSDQRRLRAEKREVAPEIGHLVEKAHGVVGIELVVLVTDETPPIVLEPD